MNIEFSQKVKKKKKKRFFSYTASPNTIFDTTKYIAMQKNKTKHAGPLATHLSLAVQQA